MASNTSLDAAQTANLIQPQSSTAEEVEASLERPKRQLADLQKHPSLSSETRFDLAYVAAHAFLQVALRMKGYKTTKEKGHRQILFTLLPELVPGAAGSQRILADAHAKRNLIEYESFVEVTGGFIDEMVNAIKSVAEEVEFEFEKFKAANAPPAPPPPASKPKAGSKRR